MRYVSFDMAMISLLKYTVHNFGGYDINCTHKVYWFRPVFGPRYKYVVSRYRKAVSILQDSAALPCTHCVRPGSVKCSPIPSHIGLALALEGNGGILQLVCYCTPCFSFSW